jgi:hypothetical protein
MLSFFFFSVLGLELRAFTLSHSASSIFVMGFFEIGSSQSYLPGLAWNFDPPDLCLLSRQNYRCEPRAPSSLNSLLSTQGSNEG